MGTEEFAAAALTMLVNVEPYADSHVPRLF